MNYPQFEPLFEEVLECFQGVMEDGRQLWPGTGELKL
jgi:hypothetical protein